MGPRLSLRSLRGRTRWGTTLHLFPAGWMSACGGECLQGCWQSNRPRAGQPCPAKVNMLLIPLRFSPVWLVQSRKGGRADVKGWVGWKRKKGAEGEDLPCHTASLCWYALDSYQHTQTKRSVCTQHRRVFLDVRITLEMSLGSRTAASALGALHPAEEHLRRAAPVKSV